MSLKGYQDTICRVEFVRNSLGYIDAIRLHPASEKLLPLEAKPYYSCELTFETVARQQVTEVREVKTQIEWSTDD